MFGQREFSETWLEVGIKTKFRYRNSPQTTMLERDSVQGPVSRRVYELQILSKFMLLSPQQQWSDQVTILQIS